jgi:hypothetical protein
MSTGKLIGGMLIFVILGAPLVWFLWEVLNGLLAGHFDGIRLLLAIPVAALFAGLLVLLSRTVRRWESSGR